MTLSSAGLRAARKLLGLKQAELAEIMGMPPAALCAIENGRRRPTKIQEAFMAFLIQHPPKGRLFHDEEVEEDSED